MPLAVHNRIAIPAPWPAIVASTADALAGNDALASVRNAISAQLGHRPVSLFKGARYALAAFLRGLDPERPAVLVPAFGCTILIAAVRAAGREPRLVDIETDRYGLSPDDLEQKLSPDVAAVIAVHEFGIPCDARVIALARAAPGVALIEDLAIAFGARRADGAPVGRDGDAVLVSGGLGKPLSAVSFGALATSAGNGAPETNGRNAGLASAATLLLARTAAAPLVYSLAAAVTDIEAGRDEIYDRRAEAQAPSRFDAALIARGLARLDDDLAIRESLAQTLLPLFERHGWRGPRPAGDRPVYGRLPMMLPQDVDRAAAIAAFRSEGIDLSIPGRRSLAEQIPGISRTAFPGACQAEDHLLAATVNPRRGDAAGFAARAERALRRLERIRT